MIGLPINGVFVIYDEGFICSNDAVIDVDSNIIKGADRSQKSVSRKRVLKIKKPFVHNAAPMEHRPVICVTRLVTGNIAYYDGFLSAMYDKVRAEITLTSTAKTDKISELLLRIKDL